ncbi:manganese-binding transcriptional regulator MntR [Stieleria sp. ICT_E10.1]|uniref:manganese-binding transcriptional regulator MntR n=1 Tax=Stieleria sedimenti TaxID=2976331 RepID=UPI00217FBF6F|nr:manganese-binding transcriptional regulator MntR [Stieleria sedimenti]MCS7466326.1 manganese-binding transcriptional regulator MntR [Stieleria sedimenti]
MSETKHQRTRDDHATEVAEDYVEAIAELADARGACRSTDLAQHFAVTQATVSNTVARLKRDGLVMTEPYQPIFLTPAGKRLATKSRRRHQIVEQFLRKLGVSKKSAAVDSEGIEHHVGKETLAAMKAVLESGWPKEQ